MEESVSAEHRPASGTQVVHQASLKRHNQTNKQVTSLVTAASAVDQPATYPGHVLCDYKQTPVLIHYHSKQLHQVIVS